VDRRNDWLSLRSVSDRHIRRTRTQGEMLTFVRSMGILIHRDIFPLGEANMSDITISLPEDKLAKLKEMAAGVGTSPEELVRASVEDLLGRPDEQFQRAAAYVLQKNEELYRRLA
jgi:antitoxin FitA